MMWTTELTEEEERMLALIPDCPRRKKPPHCLRKAQAHCRRPHRRQPLRAFRGGNREAW